MSKEPQTTSIDIELGRLLWGEIRNYVGKANAHGFSLKLWEGQGFLSRDFVISGSQEEMSIVKRDLARWAKQMEDA